MGVEASISFEVNWMVNRSTNYKNFPQLLTAFNGITCRKMKSLEFFEFFLEIGFFLFDRARRLLPREHKNLDLDVDDLIRFGIENELHISEVTREFFYYDKEVGYTLGLVLCPCFCIYLDNPTENSWSFIKRVSRSYGEFPNGYTVVLTEGNLSQKSGEVLQEIASNEELNRVNLEIEHFGDKVCAYTINVPDTDIVDYIHAYLIQLVDETA